MYSVLVQVPLHNVTGKQELTITLSSSNVSFEDTVSSFSPRMRRCRLLFRIRVSSVEADTPEVWELQNGDASFCRFASKPWKIRS
jgi:hypothetical protein